MSLIALILAVPYGTFLSASDVVSRRERLKISRRGAVDGKIAEPTPLFRMLGAIGAVKQSCTL